MAFKIIRGHIITLKLGMYEVGLHNGLAAGLCFGSHRVQWSTHETMRPRDIKDRLRLEVHCPPDGTFWKKSVQHTTDIDLIERFSDRRVHKAHLDHEQLVKHFAEYDAKKTTSTDTIVEEPTTRIFLLNDLNFSPKLDTNSIALLEPDTTALWLQQRFNVSPLFFRLIREMSNLTEGRKAAFLDRDEHRKPVSLDGFYTIWQGAPNMQHTLIWFSHDLDHQRSTYMIYNMSEEKKGFIRDMYGQDYNQKGCPPPFALDVLIARLSLLTTQNTILNTLNGLSELEDKTSAPQLKKPDELVITAHTLAKDIYAIRSTLGTVKLILAFLKDTNEKWSKLKPAIERRDKFEEMGFDPTQESLRMLDEELEHTTLWLTNFIDRCSVQINLLFNLANQRDNRTNLRISESTSKISEATQRDSASMITMAVVTMFFLPGTFVSAIFGMSFFEQNSRGDRISVTNDWILYLIITIPLTIVVFIVWGLWRYLRLRWQESKHKQSEPEPESKSTTSSGSDTESTTSSDPDAGAQLVRGENGSVRGGRNRKRESDSSQV